MRGNPVLLELAQLLEAGLDPATAVSRIRADNSADTRALEQLGMTLRRGRSLAAGLAAAGYTGKLDNAIIGVGEQTGKITTALRALARRVERRRSRTTRLRAQLWLPNAVLVIMLASNVVRALAAGTELSVALLDAALVGIPVFGIACAIVAATAHDTIAWLRMAWRTKLIDSSATLREYFNCTFFTLFAWQANAGVDLITGATTLAALIDDPRYRQQVERYRAALRRGESVTTALTGAGLLRGGELNEVLRVAEHAGRIGSALEHYLVAQGERLERITDIVFAWLPRAYYAVVFVLGGLSLL